MRSCAGNDRPRVAVVAEWYPSSADPVLGIWAHRQALAARAAGADVRVLALRRPVPPLSAARAVGRGDVGPLRTWGRGVRSFLAPWEHDGLSVTPVPFVSPPRPLSYGTWGAWMAPPLTRALDRLHAQWPLDVVHVHNIVPGADAALPWLRSEGNARPTFVVSTHGPDVIRDAHRSPLARRAARRALRAADVVMANSSWAARRCEEITGAQLPTRVVHLGADVPTNRLQRRGRTTLVTVAHLVARKRHAVVLHALAALPPGERPDYLVVGDGPGRGPLERLAADLGLAHRVTFTGQLAPEEALAELGRCHLFVMPGVEEPFGVAFVEAMAAGLPAIGARGEGGPEDIAAAGEGMLLVPADDHAALAAAIAALLRDPAERERLGDAARATVERCFTWGRCGERTVAAYAEALERRRKPIASPAGRAT